MVELLVCLDTKLTLDTIRQERYIIIQVQKYTITLIANEVSSNNFSIANANSHIHCHIPNHNLHLRCRNITIYFYGKHAANHLTANCFRTSSHLHLNATSGMDVIL